MTELFLAASAWVCLRAVAGQMHMAGAQLKRIPPGRVRSCATPLALSLLIPRASVHALQPYLKRCIRGACVWLFARSVICQRELCSMRVLPSRGVQTTPHTNHAPRFSKRTPSQRGSGVSRAAAVQPAEEVKGMQEVLNGLKYNEAGLIAVIVQV